MNDASEKKVTVEEVRQKIIQILDDLENEKISPKKASEMAEKIENFLNTTTSSFENQKDS